MFKKKIKILLFSLLFYQSPVFSKSSSFNEINSRNLSNYFSGIVAYENKNNSEALNFFNSSKILINQHDSYLKRYVMSLVLEEKVSQAINLIKSNTNKNNSDFFEAYILLVLDNLKKKDFNKASEILFEVPEYLKEDRLNIIILKSLNKYIEVFKTKKIKKENENFGNLSIINETFQRCYLDDKNTDASFSNLINNPKADYSRYIYFYISYLINKNQLEKVKSITKELNYINTSLLLSQGKSWVEKKKLQ